MSPVRDRSAPRCGSTHARAGLRTRTARHARGLATLAMVLGLLALAAWSAASSQRALASELRAAASHLRAAEAFEAAQGGVDFALALLHAGPVNAACAAAAAPAQSLAQWLERGPAELSCRHGSQGWACQCPALADTAGSGGSGGSGGSADTPGTAEAAEATFRVEIRPEGAGGAVRLRAFGQGRRGSGAATVTVLAAPVVGAGGARWQRVPGSWRDF